MLVRFKFLSVSSIEPLGHFFNCFPDEFLGNLAESLPTLAFVSNNPCMPLIALRHGISPSQHGKVAYRVSLKRRI